LPDSNSRVSAEAEAEHRSGPSVETIEPLALKLAASEQRRLAISGTNMRVSAGAAPALGRLAGNRAVQRLVQRNGDASATPGRPQPQTLQRDDDDVATTPTTGTTATATPTTPSEPPKVEPPKPKATPEDPLAKSKALKIITDTFAGVKKGLVEGDVQVLPLAEFKAAYDKIYGAGPYSWDKYVKPKFGDLEGFAYNNVNYINKDNAGTNIGTVVHEMLHNNTADDWRAVVGNQFDEGTTEFMSLEACNAASAPYGKSYPDQLSCVEGLIAAGLPVADLRTAYLVGGGQKLLADWFNATMQGSWAEFKVSMQAEDYVAAKAKIKKKTT
jgi:hypothetical protein